MKYFLNDKEVTAEELKTAREQMVARNSDEYYSWCECAHCLGDWTCESIELEYMDSDSMYFSFHYEVCCS